MDRAVNSRLAEAEKLLGRDLPGSYVEFLASHRSRDFFDGYLASNPDYWGIRAVFEIGDGSAHDQADQVFRLVGEVIPKLMFPVADDPAGDLYLLDLSNDARVVLWSHERGESDDSVAEVATSFQEFVGLIRESPGGL